MNAQALSGLHGHANISITLDSYGHAPAPDAVLKHLAPTEARRHSGPIPGHRSDQPKSLDTLRWVQERPTIIRPPSHPPIRRLDPRNLRAAWWAWRAAGRTRRKLGSGGLDAALALPVPPPLPAEAQRGVDAALRRRGGTCLVRSIVLQTWLAAHGEARDLIVGVTEPGETFKAHAWLDGEPPHADGPFHELLRRPAPNLRTYLR